MKYTRGQFTNEYYQLWQLGLQISIPQVSKVYSVKYRTNDFEEYSQVTLKSVSVSDALERACYAAAHSSLWRPEDIDLHAVYDEEENLLWVDEAYYEVIQKKNEFRGIERREFLKRFGATSAAILYGLRPSTAHGLIPFGFIRKVKNGNEQLYTTAGTYTWTVPVGVTSVHVVVVGGGGSGAFAGTPGGVGGTSSFGTVTATGGGGGSYDSSGSITAAGGSYSGADGGGTGGRGGTSMANSNWFTGGGGGAGGYIGSGGAGGAYNSSYYGTAADTNSGGGGGGGGGASNYLRWNAGGGGGVGLYGKGSDGAAGSNTGNGGGGGGSNGLAGSDLLGGKFGAGGGGSTGLSGGGGGGALAYKNNIIVTPGNTVSVVVGAGATAGSNGGSVGAVRIIWGAGRSFPNNAT